MVELFFHFHQSKKFLVLLKANKYLFIVMVRAFGMHVLKQELHLMNMLITWIRSPFVCQKDLVHRQVQCSLEQKIKWNMPDIGENCLAVE